MKASTISDNPIMMPGITPARNSCAIEMLDEPLQSLDSINVLGMVDVLRRFRAQRQIIVATHEPRFLGLLQRKLRPIRSDERMMTIIFDGWTRAGPDIRAIPITYDRAEATVLAA